MHPALPEEHTGGSQHQFVCAMRALSYQDGAVTEVALLPQGPQLLHQLAAVVWQLHHFTWRAGGGRMTCSFL